jgi:hypothetical protein
MLAGQRQLKDDSFRGRIFGAGELRLDDWFVPVLYQEKDDPQLFKSTPAKQTLADFQAALTARLGELPSIPETGFIGLVDQLVKDIGRNPAHFEVELRAAAIKMSGFMSNMCYPLLFRPVYKEYFWGGWISVVVEGDRWQTAIPSAPQNLDPKNLDLKTSI